MAIEVKKREGESSSAMIYRFTKKVQRSGVLRETKKRRFHKRAPSKLKRKISALHRETRRKENERARKLGLL